jgi:phosphoribosylaminoimidazolecarboxamide formyltransferase / IMP cyclohydrolase
MFPDTPAAVVIKHNTPCGIALGDNIAIALKRAIEADSTSAFGGIVVTNQTLDLDAAQVLEEFKEGHGQMDVISAPSIPPKVLEKLISLRKNAGIYTFGKIPKKRSKRYQTKPIYGGFILQEWDDEKTKIEDWVFATQIKPTRKQLELMRFGWDAVRRMKSNTIVIVDKDIPMTRGIGTGQTSRIAAVQIALKQAGKNTIGSILISDSFFPFGDSVKLARDLGVGAILQQGGSKNDKDSIKVANETGIPMVFTGRRAFWH